MLENQPTCKGCGCLYPVEYSMHQDYCDECYTCPQEEKRVDNRVVAQLSNSKGEKENKYMFYCEGCQKNHMFDERWTFNGDFINPTFTPSLLYSFGHHPDRPDVCHSFVTNGKIQFLSDCTHELAGRTVDLTPID